MLGICAGNTNEKIKYGDILVVDIKQESYYDRRCYALNLINIFRFNLF